MKAIALIIIAVMIFIYINIEISAMNPCSNFSHNPGDCNSDRL